MFPSFFFPYNFIFLAEADMENVTVGLRQNINKVECASCEDSDQHWHAAKFDRIFAVAMEVPWSLSYSYTLTSQHVLFPLMVQNNDVVLKKALQWESTTLSAHRRL